MRSAILALLLLTACASTPKQAEPPIPFSTDGCSGPTHFKNADYEKACCEPHDKDYWRGGTWKQRYESDVRLHTCVTAKGYKMDADLMFAAVRLGGGPEHNTSYRWGYGWPYPHPYDKER